MKQINRLILAFGLLVVGFAGSAKAGWLWEAYPDKTVSLRYRFTVAASASTSTVVIDLSNTTSWPHTETGEINITSMRVDFDKAAASTGTVKLGVVTFVDASTGSVTWFYSKETTLNVSNTTNESMPNPVSTAYRLKVNGAGPQSDGTTPYLLSNDKTSGSTTYQTDVNLPTPVGNSPPGLGDVVMSVVNGTGAVTINLEIQYHANAR